MVKRNAENAISEDENTNENGKADENSSKSTGKRLKTKSLYRQPTVKELNRLQETENLFNSNLFRLQIEEILQEVKVKEKTENKFQQWYTEFKSHLLSIPKDDNEYDLAEPQLFKKLKVKLPLSGKLAKMKCFFKFHKYKDINIVGAYSLGCAINSKLTVDLEIVVPAATYAKTDSVNYRYHKKRAAYLAYIAAHISGHETVESVDYTFLNDCKSKPMLDIIPSGKLGKHLSVRIRLSCQEEAYKLQRLSLSRNNLRETWLSDTPEDNKVGPPTPYYNSTILCDLTTAVNEDFMKKILLNSQNLKEAIVLLKIWLRQRKLQVSGYFVSMLVAYLVHNRRVNNIMSSYQIVRNVWIFLKSSELDVNGITLHKGEETPSLVEYHQHFPVVFLDRTGYYNICWQMCKGTYSALKRESALAVDMLDNSNINSFLPLFMVSFQPLLQFDHILSFKDLQHVKQLVLATASPAVQLNYGVDELTLVTDLLHALLTRGLSNRVHLIQQMVDANFTWSVKKSAKKAVNGYKESLAFGIILNPETCLNIVDKGPPANFPEAEDFRAFWGDKSELRRFQDGSITEACVWSAATLADRRCIGKQIVNYLMTLKYGIPTSDLFHVCDQLETLGYSKLNGVRIEEASVDVLRAFDDLRRDLRGLTQLPLDISAVYGTSAVFSYCEPAVAVAGQARGKPWRRANACLIKEIQSGSSGWLLPRYVPPNHAILELGHSGKWPGDIEAFRCLKAAFNLQIAEQLYKQYSLPAQPHPTHIDVLKNGLVFRLEIAHAKEITLLRKQMDNGVARFRETEESVRVQCETVLMPRLRGALHALHQKHAAFGATVCALKRWLNGHLLCPPHFPPTAAELVVAAVFLLPAPLVPPAVPTAGFFRVLTLLAEKDWAKEMLVLDFNGDMTREEILELETQFSSREEKSQKMHIVTSYDGDLPSVWTAEAPSPQVLGRVQALARSTLKYMNQALLSDMKENVLGAFVPSLDGYDVIIALRLPAVAARGASASATEASADLVPVVGFDPVRCYLRQLTAGYSEFALFFHDSYGGDKIAVLWKPGIDEIREFQILNANALKPVEVDGETKYVVNKEAILEDFRLLGEGLVDRVQVCS
ncbi:hypothetical protein ACJJTC_015183 [Scirpophaga incertulas]